MYSCYLLMSQFTLKSLIFLSRSYAVSVSADAQVKILNKNRIN